MPTDHTANIDYINASWLEGPTSERGYIAAQGPVPNAFAAFWSMIWENDIKVIVMLTQEIEGNKLKCHRYWPKMLSFSDGSTESLNHTSENPTEYYGDVIVTLVSETSSDTYITSILDVERGGIVRTCTIFQLSQ